MYLRPPRWQYNEGRHSRLSIRGNGTACSGRGSADTGTGIRLHEALHEALHEEASGTL